MKQSAKTIELKLERTILAPPGSIQKWMGSFTGSPTGIPTTGDSRRSIDRVASSIRGCRGTPWEKSPPLL